MGNMLKIDEQLAMSIFDCFTSQLYNKLELNACLIWMGDEVSLTEGLAEHFP